MYCPKRSTQVTAVIGHLKHWTFSKVTNAAYVFQDDQLLPVLSFCLKSPFALRVTTPRVRHFNCIMSYDFKSGPGVMKRKISPPPLPPFLNTFISYIKLLYKSCCLIEKKQSYFCDTVVLDVKLKEKIVNLKF
jgi:hypothetical protein